jgi:protein O-mannosyl-transferase
VPALAQVCTSLRSSRWLGFLLFLFTVAIFFPACRNEFVNWDDPIYVTKNSHVAAGLTADSIQYAWTTFDSANWIPLTWLSYELDATLFGVNPMAFHATNVCLHAVNVWLLFLLLRGMTGAIGRSAVVALLFAVHPLHVESVAWVSERKDVLSTAGLLLTLLAYVRFASKPTPLRYLVVCVTYALGLLSKSMLVTLPVLMLFVDHWPLQRISYDDEAPLDFETFDDSRRSLLQLFAGKLPLLALAFLAGLVTLAAQERAMERMTLLPIAYRIANAISATGWYLWKTILPTGLCAHYQHPYQDVYLPGTAFAAIVFFLITTFVAFASRNRPHLAFGWLWFLTSLLPVIGLIQVGSQSYADRYAYIPHIGLFVLLVWEAHHWSGHFRVSPRLGVGLSVAMFAALVWQTERQIATWHDSTILWKTVLDRDPLNPQAHSLLGDLKFERKEWRAAQDHFESTLVKLPGDAWAIMQLARIHEQLAEPDVAAAYYRWRLRVTPNHVAATDALSKLNVDDPEEFVSVDLTAIERTRDGLRHAQRGDLPSALTEFLVAVRLEPNYGLALNSAALTLENLGQRDEALRHYEQALRANPLNVEAHIGSNRIARLSDRR